MKLPFSYRDHFFKPVLMASLLGHATFLGAGSGVIGTPQFSVKQAPTSMEVLIVPEKRLKSEREKARIFSTTDARAERSVQVREREKQDVKKPVEKPLYQPLVKGVLSEAQPDFMLNEPPVYPEFAREQGWQGTVILKVLVRKDGWPASVSVIRSSGYRILDEAALQAVRHWRFLPARMGSFAFASTVKIPVRFVLTDQVETLPHD